jgi:hypothetical protein
MYHHDLDRESPYHKSELKKIIENPELPVFVTVGFYSEFLKDYVFMICHECNFASGYIRRGIWLKRSESQLIDNYLDSKRIDTAIKEYLYEIPYVLTPYVLT